MTGAAAVFRTFPALLLFGALAFGAAGANAQRDFPEGFPKDEFPIHETMRLGMASSPIDALDRIQYILHFGSSLPPEELKQWYRDTFEDRGWTDQNAKEENKLWYTTAGQIATLTFRESEGGGSYIQLSYRMLKSARRAERPATGSTAAVSEGPAGEESEGTNEVSGLPEGFPIPVRPDMEVRSVGHHLVGMEYSVDFTVDDSLEAIRDWYEAELPDRGWEANRVAYVRIDVENADYEGSIHFRLSPVSGGTTVQVRVKSWD